MPIYVKQNRLLYNKVRYSVYPINTSIIPNHINNSTIARLTNKNPNTDRLVYSSQNPYGGVGDAGIWVRNPNCWINGVSNISCFSPAQRSGANWRQRGGTLVTKKHFILGRHFQFTEGYPIIFVDENNNAIKRTLIKYEYDTVATDIAVGLLDSEVPNNIKIAKVLPSNYQDYFGYPANLLAVSLDQEEKASLVVWDGLLNYIVTAGKYQYVYIRLLDNNAIPNSPYLSYSAFSETAVTGDSGNPIMVIIDNELIMIGYWHTTIGGPFITNRYDSINQIINSLSPNEGYSLSPINLELVYNKYS